MSEEHAGGVALVTDEFGLNLGLDVAAWMVADHSRWGADVDAGDPPAPIVAGDLRGHHDNEDRVVALKELRS